MKILAIETSCDETSVAVVENGTKLLSNVVASSSPIHTTTGGIIPENAARQQVTSMIPVLKSALQNSLAHENANSSQKIKLLNDYIAKEIDAIAVTYGPGLIGSLLVGVETAKTLSYLFNKPLIPVNHLVAHIYANWINTEENSSTHHAPQTTPQPLFPALALVVSGGHTDLVLLKDHGDISWVGGTRDDAAGEAFDKTARLLGLPYPGGPSISNAAEKYFSQNKNTKLNLFPRPMIIENNFDFSFSGLKTSVYNYVSETKDKLGEGEVNHLSAQIQEAICDVIVHKCFRAVKKYSPQSFLLAGGVSANKRLRDKFFAKFDADLPNTKIFIPPVNLCTDNAGYIASCAFFNNNQIDWKGVVANPGLSIND